MILLVMALTILGIVVIGSAVPGAGFQKKQIIGAGAGFIIMMVMMLVDYNWILKFHWAIYALCILMLGAVLVLGKNVKGATRWIAVSDGISIQPSEFAKILLVLF